MKKPMMPASHTSKPAKGEAQKIKAESKKTMTPAQWEKSATDAKMDRSEAKKRGEPLAKYEDSPADKAADKKQLAAHNAKVAKKGGK